MQEIITVIVKLKDMMSVEGESETARMIAFSGEAKGAWFRGTILPHGVDTQRISKEGGVQLSARYMLEGVDDLGKSCHMYIENNGCEDEAGCIHTRPQILTDSSSLRWLEKAELEGTVEGMEDQVLIHIYAK